MHKRNTAIKVAVNTGTSTKITKGYNISLGTQVRSFFTITFTLASGKIGMVGSGMSMFNPPNGNTNDPYSVLLCLKEMLDVRYLVFDLNAAYNDSFKTLPKECIVSVDKYRSSNNSGMFIGVIDLNKL